MQACLLGAGHIRDVNCTTQQVRTFLQPPIQGVVLETYGSGNGPDSWQDLMDELRAASSRGVIFVNCTQCLYGSVVDSYATGKVSNTISPLPPPLFQVPHFYC